MASSGSNVGRTVVFLAIGVVVAALATGIAAFIKRAVEDATPLYAEVTEVPSVGASPPSSQWAPAVDQARPMVRDAIVAQNLPGLSIAVGSGQSVIWAEGFGWRDVRSEAPITPATRFNIGTAAPVVLASWTTTFGMTDTGTDEAAAWSPEHVGEPEEDPPFMQALHDVILRPLGISSPAEPLPEERATFYVPSAEDGDPHHGRRPMYMRDLACCADGKAFYSTPSDLVRFALATHPADITGELAGASVMSLVTRPDRDIVVVVTSNMANADTETLARKVAEVFAAQP